MREFVWGLFDIWNVIQEMTWQISVVIFLVLFCRFFVGKISKQASYLLWIVVALRLICPIMLPSQFSIFNLVQPVLITLENTSNVKENSVLNSDLLTMENPIENTMTDVQDKEDTFITNSNGIMVGEETNTADTYNNDATIQVEEPKYHNNFIKSNMDFIIWLTGMTGMFAYGICMCASLKRKLRFATKCEHNIFESDVVFSPFVFGVMKPRIYLPYHLSEDERRYILLHENYHIKRRDYLVKIVAFALLAVYWFNPLVWVAFYMMSRDMELSCDEQVLKRLGIVERKAYSTLLLSFASQKRFPLPSPVSFGENDIKSRIKGILNYKKPTCRSLLGMLVLIVALVAGCLTDAKEEKFKTSEESTEMMAEKLFTMKSPYIGDVVTNGKILNELFNKLGIEGLNGMELQTRMEPYWISITFDEEPDNHKMWQASAMFLALVENANEVRWSYYDEYDSMQTYYVTTDAVNHWMEGTNIKDYVSSEEELVKLWEMLEEKRIYATYSAEGESSFLVETTTWDACAVKAEMDFTERIEWENRLNADGIAYRGDNGLVRHCFYQDFDNNGIKDFIVIIQDLNWDDDIAQYFYIYMNDDPLYSLVLPMSCLSMEILSGDIDHDGNTELIYSAHNGGNGGAGGYVKGILKYKNHTFTEMKMPGDFTKEELADGDAGYKIDVYFGKEKDTYSVVAPSVKDFGIIASEYLKNEDGSYIVKPDVGSIAGGNCRGFYKFNIIHENGQDYLMAEEYFHGEGGVNHGLGYIRFIFDWSDIKGWIVREATVHPYINNALNDTDIFEAMKQEILYYPDNYEDLTQNWSNIPVINYNDDFVYESNVALTQYAHMASSKGMSTGSIIFVKLNEKSELTYVYVNYRDDKYYYLEDYTRVSDKPYYANDEDYYQKVYDYELYFAMQYPNGNCFEHFYLTDEANLSKDDIFDSRLSIQYPPKFITVYTKKLDEEGMEVYTMLTGDFIEQGIKITMPQNHSWIGNPRYEIEDGVVCGTYTDFHMDAEMIIRVGEREEVLNKSRAGLKESLKEWNFEIWGARTSDGEYVEIELYLEKHGETNFNTVVAKWEYEENTYLIYGDTKSTDGSSVAKTAINIIEHFEKHE